MRMPTASTFRIVLLFVFPIGIFCSDVPTKPIVAMQLSDAGMHRELSYAIQFSDTLHNKKCEYILEQLLPAGIYISVDQLDDLKRLRKLNAVYPSFVDIELPTEKSKAFTILLKGNPQPLDSMSLPIHYRYHAPSKKSNKFATVEIPIPKLYIRCYGHDVLSIEDLIETASKYKYCLNEGNINFVQQSHENDSSYAILTNDTKTFGNCEWYLIDVHFQLKTDLRADMPIGNQKSFPPILYATIIISWAVSLWTVFRTNAIPRRINYKLEEQRILQNKIK